MGEGMGLSVSRFGVFELDYSAGELRKRGLRLRLQRQPFQLLIALVACPGELVTRTLLKEKLWPDVVFLDFEHELNKAINKLRLALGDNARSPRYIETLCGHGYRFIAPLRTEIAASPSAGEHTFRIAVLPFVDLASDPQHQIFADCLTTETIIRLGALHPDGLRVIARTSVFRYRGASRPLCEIAKELGVEHILTGATCRVGTRVFLAAELFHAQDQVCLWTHSSASEAGDLFAVQQEIARGIAESLKAELRPERLAAYERSRRENARERSLFERPVSAEPQNGSRPEDGLA